MSSNDRFDPPSVKQRGQLARLMAQVFEKRPAHGEATGTIRCICGGSLRFAVQASGISRGQCNSCTTRWCQ